MARSQPEFICHWFPLPALLSLYMEFGGRTKVKEAALRLAPREVYSK